MKTAFVLAGLSLVGCTDAYLANVMSVGSSGYVRCYSGSTVIYEGHSTGKIETVDHSDGWQFKDKQTGKFIRVSGPCVIEN